METVKLLIADDHELILNGIKDMLRPFKRYKIVATAVNGRQAIDRAIEYKPDVIFTDISMPVANGIEVANFISKKFPEIKLLALTQHEENEYVLQFLNAGGHGYLLKNSTKNDFVEAIETVLSGKRYLSEQISQQMINNLISGKTNQPDQEEVHLTKREREIIQHIADDLSNQQIADELNISLRTVETHRRNIMQKLKVKTVVALLKYASLHNIISFD